MKLNVTKEIKSNGRGGVIRGEYSSGYKGIGCLDVVDAVPARLGRYLVTHGVATLTTSNVGIVVVRWLAIAAAHH